MVKATKNSEAGILADEKLLTEMGDFDQKLIEAGDARGRGLHPTVKGKREGPGIRCGRDAPEPTTPQPVPDL